jgi:hypothetical protein
MKVLPDTIVVQEVRRTGEVTGIIAIANFGNDSLLVGPIEIDSPSGGTTVLMDNAALIPPGITENVGISFRPAHEGRFSVHCRIYGQNAVELVTLVGEIALSARRQSLESLHQDGNSATGESLENTLSGMETREMPDEVSLFQNFPNPFNPETEIRYSLVEVSRVELKVFDVVGSEVAVLADEVQPAGFHSIRWGGTDIAGRSLSSGIYFCRLTTGKTTIIRKMLLVR